MSDNCHGQDAVTAPSDYADLFRKYYSYVVALVRRSGIDESRAEDVAQEILMRFFERDFLAEFDPTLVFTYDGKSRPARFKSFLTKIVLSYVRGHWDKQQINKSREPLLCDTIVTADHGQSGQNNRITTWIETFGQTVDGPEDDILELLSEAALVAELRAYLAAVPKRSRYDTCDLVALFDLVVEQIRARGELDATAIRRHFNISTTAVHSWRWWLLENLADALNRPLPAKRPRATKSSMVAPPHPKLIAP